MAVLVHVHNHGSPPTKEEIAKSGTEDDGKTEPDVVGHEHQHEAVADKDLDHV